MKYLDAKWFKGWLLSVKRELSVYISSRSFILTGLVVIFLAILSSQTLISPLKVKVKTIPGDSEILKKANRIIALIEISPNLEVSRDKFSDVQLVIKHSSITLIPVSVKGLRGISEIKSLLISDECNSSQGIKVDLRAVGNLKDSFQGTWLTLISLIPLQVLAITSFDDLHGGLGLTYYQLGKLRGFTFMKILISTFIGITLTLITYTLMNAIAHIKILSTSFLKVGLNYASLLVAVSSLSLIISWLVDDRVRAINLIRLITAILILAPIVGSYLHIPKQISYIIPTLQPHQMMNRLIIPLYILSFISLGLALAVISLPKPKS